MWNKKNIIDGALPIILIGALVLLLDILDTILVWVFFIGWFSEFRQWITGSLFPFIYVNHFAPFIGIKTKYPITDYPIFFTLAQWSGFIILNVFFSSKKYFRTPLRSAIVILASIGLSTFILIKILGLKFG